MERLFEKGALDVYWIPIFMKKNRPGTLVQVLCPEDCREIVIDLYLIGNHFFGGKRLKCKKTYAGTGNLSSWKQPTVKYR